MERILKANSPMLNLVLCAYTRNYIFSLAYTHNVERETKRQRDRKRQRGKWLEGE